jgi:hypothetical protein
MIFPERLHPPFRIMLQQNSGSALAPPLISIGA